jgi:hypothetical protein
MTEARGAVLTDKQAQLLVELEQKRYEKPLTENQLKTLNDLIAKRDAPPELSQTTKSYLQKLFIKEVLHREKDVVSEYLEKGIWVEEDSLTLVSRYLDMLLVKNKKAEGQDYTHSNDYVTGTPDAITDAFVLDIKSNWDIYSFMDEYLNGMQGNVKINDLYYWQLQGYMWLTGKTVAKLAYCIVDTPEHIRASIKRKAMYDSGFYDGTPEWAELEAEIDRTYTYGDITQAKRVKIHEIQADTDAVEQLKARIEMCRNYLNLIAQYYGK